MAQLAGDNEHTNMLNSDAGLCVCYSNVCRSQSSCCLIGVLVSLIGCTHSPEQSIDKTTTHPNGSRQIGLEPIC